MLAAMIRHMNLMDLPLLFRSSEGKVARYIQGMHRKAMRFNVTSQ